VVALLGVFSSPFLAQWLRSLQVTSIPAWAWLLGFALAYVIVAVASTTPSQYARIEILEAMLPTIAAVLKLEKSTDRLAIHHMKSQSREKYIQLTNYWPSGTGKGREYTFSQGIVGRVFKTRVPNLYTVPQNMAFLDAMKDDWSFSGDELSRLTQDRRAFFAYPLGSDGAVARAVLYVDSSNTRTLSDKETLVKTIDEMFLGQLEAILRS
jgi:hypothetical protein